MKLSGVEFALLIRDGGDRRIGRYGNRTKAVWQPRHPVAMAHPYRIPLALAPHAVKQGTILGHLHLGAAELAMVAALDLAAELVRHRLLAVADAEHRQTGLIKLGRRQRGVGVEHRGRAAREDHGPGLHCREGFARLLERYDLA